MNLFKDVERNGAMNDFINMETFGRSLMVLFWMCTSSGWNDVVDAYSLQEPYCDRSRTDLGR